MSVFKVRASHDLIVSESALFDIEASDAEEAIRVARQRNLEGKLPWDADSQDQPEPTAFEIVEE